MKVSPNTKTISSFHTNQIKSQNAQSTSDTKTVHKAKPQELVHHYSDKHNTSMTNTCPCYQIYQKLQHIIEQMSRVHTLALVAINGC